MAAPAKSKSLGKEHTFQKDVTDFAYLRDALRLIAKRLGFKIRLGGLSAKTVTLKVTYANMVQITRAKSVAGATYSTAGEIYETAAALLDKIEQRAVRLIGISLGGLRAESAQQMSLFDEGAGGSKPAQLERLMLDLQYKYGLDKISSAAELLARRNLQGDEVPEDSFNRRM